MYSTFATSLTTAAPPRVDRETLERGWRLSDGEPQSTVDAIATALEAAGETRWPADKPLRTSAVISRLSAVEARVTARVMAAVVVRPAVTLWDLHEELLAAERVDTFSAMGVGPSIYHVDAVRRYFKCSPASRDGAQIPPRVRGVDFIAYLASDDDDEVRDLIASGADAGALADSFAKRLGYERGRQVGLHVGSLPTLQLAVREQMAALRHAREALALRARQEEAGSFEAVDAASQALRRSVAFRRAYERSVTTAGPSTVTLTFALERCQGANMVSIVAAPSVEASSVVVTQQPPISAPPPPPATPAAAPHVAAAPSTLMAGRRRGRVTSAPTRVVVGDEPLSAVSAPGNGDNAAASPPSHQLPAASLLASYGGDVIRGLEASAAALLARITQAAPDALDHLPLAAVNASTAQRHVTDASSAAAAGVALWAPWAPGYAVVAARQELVSGVTLLDKEYVTLGPDAKACVDAATRGACIFDVTYTARELTTDEARRRGLSVAPGERVVAPHDAAMPFLSAALERLTSPTSPPDAVQLLRALNSDIAAHHGRLIAPYLATDVHSYCATTGRFLSRGSVPTALAMWLRTQPWIVVTANIISGDRTACGDVVVTASEARRSRPSPWRTLRLLVEGHSGSSPSGHSSSSVIAEPALHPLLAAIADSDVNGATEDSEEQMVAIAAYRRWQERYETRAANPAAASTSSYSIRAVRHDRVREVHQALLASLADAVERGVPPPRDVAIVVPLADVLRASPTALSAYQRDPQVLDSVGVLFQLSDLSPAASLLSEGDSAAYLPSVECDRRLLPSVDLSSSEFARRWSLTNAVIRDAVVTTTSSVAVALKPSIAFGSVDASVVCTELQRRTIAILTQRSETGSASTSAWCVPALVVPCAAGYFAHVEAKSENCVLYGTGMMATKFAAAFSARTPRVVSLWCIDESPSVAPLLEAVFGMRALRDAVRTDAIFSQQTHTEAAGVMAQLHVTVPWVQCMLATRFTRYYRAHKDEIKRRLASLVITVCDDTLKVVQSVTCAVSPHCSETFRVDLDSARGHYSFASNVWYLNRTATTAHAMAPSCASIFTVGSDEQPADALKHFFAGTLGAPKLDQAVLAVADTHGGALFRSVYVSMTRDAWAPAVLAERWEVPHMVSQRYSATFPPGTNPFVGIPSVPERNYEQAPRVVVGSNRTVGAKTLRDAESEAQLRRLSFVAPAQPSPRQLTPPPPPPLASSPLKRYVAPTITPPPVAGELPATVALPVAAVNLPFAENDDRATEGRVLEVDFADEGVECDGDGAELIRTVDGAADVAQSYASTLGPKTSAAHSSFISFGTYVRPGAHGDTSVVDADALRNIDSASYSRPAEQYVAMLVKRNGPPRPLSPGGSEVFTVRWMNEHGEQGTPYDVLAYIEDVRTGARSEMSFIEVKATSSTNKRSFDLSLRELLFSAEKGSAFSIYRVFNAKALVGGGGGQVKVVELRDPLALWRRGTVTLKSTIEASFSS